MPIQLAQCWFPGLAISNDKIQMYFSNKIYGCNFIKQHSETVVIRNYQNADCSLKINIFMLFIVTFATLSFHISSFWWSKESRAGLRRRRARVQIAVATLSGNSLRQTVHTHRASVHQAAKLLAALLRVARVTAGLAESNGCLPPGI